VRFFTIAVILCMGIVPNNLIQITTMNRKVLFWPLAGTETAKTKISKEFALRGNSFMVRRQENEARICRKVKYMLHVAKRLSEKRTNFAT